MVERGARSDTAREQLVDQALVEIEPLFVRAPAPLRQHARPRNAEAVSVDTEPVQESHVFFEPMIVVAGYVAAAPVLDRARGVRERVPDARLAAVFGDGSLDLVGGGGDTELEARTEGAALERAHRAVAALSTAPRAR